MGIKKCLSKDDFRLFFECLFSDNREDIDGLIDYYEMDAHIDECKRCGEIRMNLVKFFALNLDNKDKFWEFFEDFWENTQVNKSNVR